MMSTNLRDLSRYKKTLKDLKISHMEVAEHIGRTRENVTLWLNGAMPPLKTAVHVSEEIDELIFKHKFPKNLKNEKEKIALKQIMKIINDYLKK